MIGSILFAGDLDIGPLHRAPMNAVVALGAHQRQRNTGGKVQHPPLPARRILPHTRPEAQVVERRILVGGLGDPLGPALPQFDVILMLDLPPIERQPSVLTGTCILR